MNIDNKTTELDNTDKKLHISDVSCGVCGVDYKITTGYSFTWNGIYDIKRCGCNRPKVCNKHYN
jgi:hypothetical protein